jgi:hypothetical protein
MTQLDVVTDSARTRLRRGRNPMQFRGAALVCTCLFLSAWASALGAPPQTRAHAPFKPVGTIKDLMASIVDPSADVIWDATGTIITSSGTEERTPKDDKAWQAVHDAALTLAESGNLLLIDGRAKDRAAWTKMAQGLITVSVTALHAADAKDPKALADAGEAINAACETCHSVYWRQPLAHVTPLPPIPR